MSSTKRLGIGFIGSGFNTRFHIRSFVGVRDADVRGVFSPNAPHAEEAAHLARSLNVGEARAYASIDAMVASPEIDCIWICCPNYLHVGALEQIALALRNKRGRLIGVACEKPLGRNVKEAKRMLALAEESKLLHGYLENQVFMPSITAGRNIIWQRGAAHAGRPYLARAAEEHSGPHMPWFWQGDLQGGGVLNDMMCHSVEVARYLLTKPGAPRATLTPVKVSATVATLKWSRPQYAKLLSETMGAAVDYLRRPSEDFARATITYIDENNTQVISEVSTSWSFVGAGLRLSMELLGPEYAMSLNTLDSNLKLFLSRRIEGSSAEDLVEKQNAEQGLMPVVANETAEYGYEAENRYFVNCFLHGVQPEESFHDGLAVTELLMAAYMSAEQEKAIAFASGQLDDFIPQVAK